jgi:hypothetical protein
VKGVAQSNNGLRLALIPSRPVLVLEFDGLELELNNLCGADKLFLAMFLERQLGFVLLRAGSFFGPFEPPLGNISLCLYAYNLLINIFDAFFMFLGRCCLLNIVGHLVID